MAKNKDRKIPKKWWNEKDLPKAFGPYDMDTGFERLNLNPQDIPNASHREAGFYEEHADNLAQLKALLEVIWGYVSYLFPSDEVEVLVGDSLANHPIKAGSALSGYTALYHENEKDGLDPQRPGEGTSQHHQGLAVDRRIFINKKLFGVGTMPMDQKLSTIRFPGHDADDLHAVVTKLIYAGYLPDRGYGYYEGVTSNGERAASDFHIDLRNQQTKWFHHKREDLTNTNFNWIPTKIVTEEGNPKTVKNKDKKRISHAGDLKSFYDWVASIGAPEVRDRVEDKMSNYPDPTSFPFLPTWEEALSGHYQSQDEKINQARAGLDLVGKEIQAETSEAWIKMVNLSWTSGGSIPTDDEIKAAVLQEFEKFIGDTSDPEKKVTPEKLRIFERYPDVSGGRYKALVGVLMADVGTPISLIDDVSQAIVLDITPHSTDVFVPEEPGIFLVPPRAQERLKVLTNLIGKVSAAAARDRAVKSITSNLNQANAKLQIFSSQLNKLSKNILDSQDIAVKGWQEGDNTLGDTLKRLNQGNRRVPLYLVIPVKADAQQQVFSTGHLSVSTELPEVDAHGSLIKINLVAVPPQDLIDFGKESALDDTTCIGFLASSGGNATLVDSPINQIYDNSAKWEHGMTLTPSSTDWLSMGNDVYTWYDFIESYHYPKNVKIDFQSGQEKISDKNSLLMTDKEVKEQKNRIEQTNAKLALFKNREMTTTGRNYSPNTLTPQAKFKAELASTIGAPMPGGPTGDPLADFIKLNRVDTIIKDSTITNIQNGTLLGTIRTLDDLQNLWKTGITLKDLLVLALTCADRYALPNVDLMAKIDQFLKILGSFRAPVIPMDTIPVITLLDSFEKSLANNLSKIIEQAVVEYIKGILVAIASCDVADLSKASLKGVIDLFQFVTDPEALGKFASNLLGASLASVAPPQLMALYEELQTVLTPSEIRQLSIGSANDNTLLKLQESIEKQLGIKVEQAIIAMAFQELGAGSDLAALDAAIDGFNAEKEVTDICATFKQRMIDKYGPMPDSILDEAIKGLPDHNPEKYLGFDLNAALDACQIAAISDPATQQLLRTTFQSTFGGIKTKFNIELSGFSSYLIKDSTGAELFSHLDSKGQPVGGETDITPPPPPVILPSFMNLVLNDKIVTVFNFEHNILLRLEGESAASQSLQVLKTLAESNAVDTVDVTDEAGVEHEIVGTPNPLDNHVRLLEETEKALQTSVPNVDYYIFKGANPQSVKSLPLSTGPSSFTHRLQVSNHNINPNAIGIVMSDMASGVQSIEYQGGVLSMNLLRDNLSKIEKDVLNKLPKEYPYGTLLHYTSLDLKRNESFPAREAESFSRFCYEKWRRIFKPLEYAPPEGLDTDTIEQMSALYRAFFREHHSDVLRAIMKKFMMRTAFSKFLVPEALNGMKVFKNPLCPESGLPEDEIDLLGINRNISLMMQMQSTLECKGYSPEEALRTAMMASLARTYVRVLALEFAFPAIFYFSELGLEDVNADILTAYLQIVSVSDTQSRGGNTFQYISEMCNLIYIELSPGITGRSLTPTEAFKKTLTEELSLIGDIFKTLGLASMDEKNMWGQEGWIDGIAPISAGIRRRFLDTPYVPGFGFLSSGSSTARIALEARRGARFVYPELVDVPTYLSLEGGANGPVNEEELERYLDITEPFTVPKYRTNEAADLSYNLNFAECISYDNQVLNSPDSMNYFLSGGFILEKFINVLPKEKPSNFPKSYDYDVDYISLNKNISPLFDGAAAEDHYFSTDISGKHYFDDIVAKKNLTPVLEGKVGLEQFEILSNILNPTSNILEELEKVDDQIQEVWQEWYNHKHYPNISYSDAENETMSNNPRWSYPVPLFSALQNTTLYSLPADLVDPAGEELGGEWITAYKNTPFIPAAFDHFLRQKKTVTGEGVFPQPSGPEGPARPQTQFDTSQFSFLIKGDSLSDTAQSTIEYELEKDLHAISWTGENGGSYGFDFRTALFKYGKFLSTQFGVGDEDALFGGGKINLWGVEISIPDPYAIAHSYDEIFSKPGELQMIIADASWDLAVVAFGETIATKLAVMDAIKNQKVDAGLINKDVSVVEAVTSEEILEFILNESDLEFFVMPTQVVGNPFKPERLLEPSLIVSIARSAGFPGRKEEFGYLKNGGNTKGSDLVSSLVSWDSSYNTDMADYLSSDVFTAVVDLENLYGGDASGIDWEIPPWENGNALMSAEYASNVSLSSGESAIYFDRAAQVTIVVTTWICQKLGITPAEFLGDKTILEKYELPTLQHILEKDVIEDILSLYEVPVPDTEGGALSLLAPTPGAITVDVDVLFGRVLYTKLASQFEGESPSLDAALKNKFGSYRADEICYYVSAEEIFQHFRCVMEGIPFYGLDFLRFRSEWADTIETQYKKGAPLHIYQAVLWRDFKADIGGGMPWKIRFRDFRKPDTLTWDIKPPERSFIIGHQTTSDTLMGNKRTARMAYPDTWQKKGGWDNKWKDSAKSAWMKRDFNWQVGFKTTLNINPENAERILPESNLEMGANNKPIRAWGYKGEPYQMSQYVVPNNRIRHGKTHGFLGTTTIAENFAKFDPFSAEGTAALVGIFAPIPVGGLLVSAAALGGAIGGTIGAGWAEANSSDWSDEIDLAAGARLGFFVPGYQDVWKNDGGRQQATLDTLLMNIEFYLDLIKNYDSLTPHIANDITPFYISRDLDKRDLAGSLAVRLGRTIPAGFSANDLAYPKYKGPGQEEFLSFTNSEGLPSGEDGDGGVGVGKYRWHYHFGGSVARGTKYFDSLIGRTNLAVDFVPSTYPQKYDIAGVGDARKFVTPESFSDYYSHEVSSTEGKADSTPVRRQRVESDFFYHPRALYKQQEDGTYISIRGEDTNAYKLLKSWYDRLNQLNKKRKELIDGFFNFKARFIASNTDPGKPHFSTQPHTEFFHPFEVGIRLSYVLPLGPVQWEKTEAGVNMVEFLDDINLDSEGNVDLKAIFNKPVKAYKESEGVSSDDPKAYGKDKTYKISEIYSTSKATHYKRIYKIPLIEKTKKISDVYGVPPEQIPVNISSQHDFSRLYKACVDLKEDMVSDKEYRILFKFIFPLEDLSSIAAIGVHNTVLNSGDPAIRNMFTTTKSSIVDFLSYFQHSFTNWDSTARELPFEQANLLSSVDPIDASGIAKIIIMQASMMMLKTTGEMVDPAVKNAKMVKDAVYNTVSMMAVAAGQLDQGQDPKKLLNLPAVRAWRGSKIMAYLIPVAATTPAFPFITPIGLGYWAAAATGWLEPLDKLLEQLNAHNVNDVNCKD